MLQRLYQIFLILFLGYSVAHAGQETLEKIPPAFVETIKVKIVTLDDEIYATGTLLSIPGTTIRSEIAGRVTKVYFNSGDMAKEGVQLIEINSDIVGAQLTSAEAQLNLSKLNFIRAQSLYKSRDIAKSDFDQIQANYNSDKAKVEGLKAVLAQTSIVAPFSGKLGLSQVSVGDYVTAGQNIVNLQTMDPLKVDFSISESYLRRVNVGQRVSLKSDIYPNKIFSGSVEALESLVNQNNRTLTVRANIPNPEGLLIPGGFVGVTLRLAQRQIIAVPQTAIVYAGEGNYVFKMVHGKAEKIKVILGAKDQNNVEIREGLREGDIIVVAGQIKIFPGSKIIDVTAKYDGK